MENTNVGFICDPTFAGYEKTSRPSIGFWVVNYGKTPAVIRKVTATFHIREDMFFKNSSVESAFWIMGNEQELTEDVVLTSIGGAAPEVPPAGRRRAPSYRAYFRRSMRERPAEEELTAIMNASKFVYICGRIVYYDVFGAEHITPFGQRVKYGTGTGAQLVPYIDFRDKGRT
jgi:hypothetical protein